MKCDFCGYSGTPERIASHTAKRHGGNEPKRDNMTAEGNCRIVPNASGDGFVQEYVGK